MNKNIKRFSVIMMSCFLIGTLGPQIANAQEVKLDYDIELRAGGKYYYDINSSRWTTIAESSKGFNSNVFINVINTSTSINDIRLLNRNGNVVWQKDGAIGMNEKLAKFWCGSDVYKVQVRTQRGTGSATAIWNE